MFVDFVKIVLMDDMSRNICDDVLSEYYGTKKW